MGFPKSCDICGKTKVRKSLFHGDIKLAIKPFKGANPSVFLVGQDPTVNRREIYSALDLENKDGLLYKYIVHDILKPAGLKLDQVYATDLVKCHFPENQTPKEISNKHGMTIGEFLFPFFSNCRQHLVQEIGEIRPRIVMSLGEPVHQILSEEFFWNVPTQMKEAFSSTYRVNLLGNSVFYYPCIHINSRKHYHYKNLRNNFVKASREAVDSSSVV